MRKTKAFKNLLLLSTLALTATAFAHGSHNEVSAQNTLTPEQLQLEKVENMKVFKASLSNPQTVQDFESIRSQTTIVPVIYEFKPGEKVENNLKILKSNTPDYITTQQIASMQRERELASSASISPTMLTGEATAQADCVVVVNPGFVDEISLIQKAFEKDSKISASSVKSVAAEFLVRHEFAHCSQKNQLTAILTSAAFGKVLSFDEKYLTPLASASLKNQTSHLLNNFNAQDKTGNLSRYTAQDQKYDNVLYTQVEESWADGLSLLSMLSQDKISLDSVKAIAHLRSDMAQENNENDNHNTSSFLTKLTQQIENQSFKIEKNENAASLAQKMSTVWKTYVSEIEQPPVNQTAKNIYGEATAATLTAQVPEIKPVNFKQKINQFRSTEVAKTASYKM